MSARFQILIWVKWNFEGLISRDEWFGQESAAVVKQTPVYL
ncbi:MAG TPA: hypothetical protein VFZ40_12560 [Pyrinomonadaceae bacterium]